MTWRSGSIFTRSPTADRVSIAPLLRLVDPAGAAGRTSSIRVFFSDFPRSLPTMIPRFPC